MDAIATIAIVGGRSLADDQLAILFAISRRLVRAGYHVISGGAIGADTAAAMGAAIRPDRLTICVPPGHNTSFVVAGRMYTVDPHVDLTRQLADKCLPHGLSSKSTYVQGLFIRNAHLARACDGVIAWQGSSGGTAHTMRCARELGKPVLDLGEALVGHNDFYQVVRDWLKEVQG